MGRRSSVGSVGSVGVGERVVVAGVVRVVDMLMVWDVVPRG